MTNDVEEHSIALNRLDEETAWRVYREGLPRLLNLFSKYDVESTFYFTGTFAEKIPEAIELVMDYGHEIGCHGYSHEVDRAFDVLSYEEQVMDLRKAKKAIESVAGRVESFRAPAARINHHTIKALEETGFSTDSSICSQRFDGPLSFGSRKKLNWLFAPRMPYNPGYDSPFQQGNSKILEIPISAYLLGYVGTTMRVSPFLFNYLQKIIFREARKTGKPVVFVFHPVEVVDVDGKGRTHRRTTSVMEHVFADIIRHQLKVKNLGSNAMNLVEQILVNAKDEGAEFISVNTFRKKISDPCMSG